MNSGGIKTAILNSRTDCFGLRTAFFHSTPVLDRKRRNYWDSRCNNYSKRFRRIDAKQTLLRNVSAYADFLFQGPCLLDNVRDVLFSLLLIDDDVGSWQDEGEANDPSSSSGTSWFKRQYSARGSRRDRTNKGPRYWSRNFEFTEDNADVETIFRSAFGGTFYWSFINEENPQWRSSTNYSNKYGRSWNWRHRVEEEYDDSSNEYEDSEADLSTHRLALGLSASGPVKLEDVKNAYRACALKWHPDRHQGSSKVLAEEKFKLCSVAYQSLCDKLAEN